MKRYKLIYFVLALAFSVIANAENLPIDITFQINEGQSFEPYEPVLLKGTYNVRLVKEVKLSYSLNGATHLVDVALYNGNWSAYLGSFLPRQTIVLNFDVLIQADLEKIIELRQTFVDAFTQVLDNIKSNFSQEDKSIDVFQKKVIQKLNEALTNDFDNFKDKDEKTLRENVLSYLNQKDSLIEISKKIDWISSREKVIGRFLPEIEKYSNKLQSDKKTEIVNFLNYFKIKDYEKIKPEIDTSSLDSTLRVNIGHVEEFWKVLDSTQKRKSEIISNLIPDTDFLERRLFQTTLQNKQELTFALKNFMGFDVMPAYFSGRDLNSTFGLFFTVSPYFGKTDPDEKIFQRGDSCSNFRRCVTPTLGFGLTSSPKTNQVLPLVYVGIGFRINNIVRVSIGETFYTQKYATPTDGSDPVIKVGNCLTVGIGISTDYLSDFMKVFSTTVNQFGK